MTEIYRGPRLRIEKSIFRLPNGTEKERIVVRPLDAVAVLPVEGEYCYLLRQYRFAIDAYLWEAPAGTIDPGEEPQETAHREMIEETGLCPSRLIPRGFIYTTPGFTTERLHLFEARDLVPSSEYERDEDEEIEVVRLPQKEIHRMIKAGQICDAKTICLVHLCLGSTLNYML
ncbi:MAG: NUDIX hydrolase [Methanomicrobiales archaeon]|nr:NUDIX hydrolase [Methanomicrobiales archaeon]